MRKLGLALLALCLAGGVTGCGGGNDGASESKDSATERSTEAEWRTHVEKLIGHPFRNDEAWLSYSELYRGAGGWCSEDEDELALAIAVGVDAGESVGDQERHLKLACPDRSKVIDAAVASVQENASEAERICGSDPDLLSADDLDYYEAVC